MFLETVSLNDDAPSGQAHGNGDAVDVDSLEAQFPSSSSSSSYPNVVKFAKHSDAPNPVSETDDEEEDEEQREQVVVVVDSNRKAATNGRPAHPTLPPLRVAKHDQEEEGYFRDYVDPTLFSPEVSRRAVEIARGRAKTLEMELKELALLEVEKTAPVKLSPGEAVGIISSAFITSISKVKQLVTSGEKEYDLLSGSSPSSKMDDLDTDGDGLQISPDSSKGEGKHFQSKHKPALKRISAYSSLDKDKRVSKSQKQMKRIVWHEEVLDQDEEFYDDGEPAEETESLMEVNGQPILNYKNDRLTPRSKKKRKKLVKGMMRRLTPTEKEELYKQRPDLMIIPNWAQKYRQGLEDEESSRWSLWLISIIGTLAVLLIVLIILIAKEHTAAVKN